MQIAIYDSCLTEAEWAFLKPMLSKAKKRERQPTDRRSVLAAIFYVLKGGIQWRLLPINFPPWQTV